MSNQGRVRILCVEEHPLMRAGIAVVINSHVNMELVAQASNGREAIECFCEHEPDVTLMSLTLPDMFGIDAMIAIHVRFPEARIIISSTFASSVEVKRVMVAGARSYILKNMSPIEVAAAIHKVHAGKKHIPTEVATHLASISTKRRCRNARLKCCAMFRLGIQIKSSLMCLIFQSTQSKDILRTFCPNLEPTIAHTL
jgi:DNA-binding NarL/FixJ family response regulator